MTLRDRAKSEMKYISFEYRTTNKNNQADDHKINKKKDGKSTRRSKNEHDFEHCGQVSFNIQSCSLLEQKKGKEAKKKNGSGLFSPTRAGKIKIACAILFTSFHFSFALFSSFLSWSLFAVRLSAFAFSLVIYCACVIPCMLISCSL
jgi:hypothetical protein